jgi:GNAT superfamily N-acetyltransferase
MGVLPDMHRRGYGRALGLAAEAHARAEHRAVIHVKTLGPSHPSVSYARTRRFYEALGFKKPSAPPVGCVYSVPACKLEGCERGT